MFLIFDIISGIFTGILGLLVMLILVPVVVQIMIHMVINMINNALKTNIRPMLNLLFFPGALVRTSFIFFVLSLMGWKPGVFYGKLAGMHNPTSTNSRYSGFSLFMRPPKKGVTLGQTIILSLSGYFVWLWVLLLIIFQLFITNYMSYLWGAQTANLVYGLLIISMVVGGMPIPEETMLPLYYIVAHYPHLVIASLIGFVGAAIVGGLFGVVFGQIYFVILLAMLLSRHQSHARQLRRLGDYDGIRMDIDEVILF